MENANLKKITEVCRKFNECFGDTLEGRGYLTVLDMLERAGLTKSDNAPKPQTAQELFSAYKEMLSNAGIKKEYLNIEIQVYEGSVSYKSYSPIGRVEENTAKLFLSKVKDLIAQKGEEVALELRKEAMESDVTLK